MRKDVENLLCLSIGNVIGTIIVCLITWSITPAFLGAAVMIMTLMVWCGVRFLNEPPEEQKESMNQHAEPQDAAERGDDLHCSICGYPRCSLPNPYFCKECDKAEKEKGNCIHCNGYGFVFAQIGLTTRKKKCPCTGHDQPGSNCRGK